MTFEDWLTRKGFLNPYVIEANRCRIHGYGRNGIYHYPTQENSRSFYACRHCLSAQFAAMTTEEREATLEHSLMHEAPAPRSTPTPAPNPELENWHW